MRRTLVQILGISCLAFTFLAFTNKNTNDRPIWGFSKDASRQEYKLESRFDSYLNRQDMSKWLKIMTTEPNNDGSPHDKWNAEYVARLMNSWGFDAKIVRYKVLFPTPKEQLLELVYPHKFKASLREPSLKQVPVTYHRKDELPPYNIFSADGDVTADLIYVNYGVPKDYAYLKRIGVSVKGKIVIVRYGAAYRGVKAKLAYEHGAIGCIIYSDPQNDGYAQGDVYPKGPWRPKYGVQRGSVMDMTLYPGDPTTPGYPSTMNAKRIPIKDAPTIMKIPVQPISYADALPLLKALSGPVAPSSWRGALPITYHIGPGPAKVHLKLKFNWKYVIDYDTIAMIKGSEYPNQYIIRGNHRDGWVYGAEDPLSSLMAELNEAQAMGQLLKQGWRPKRTIIYCSWDGEEPGLFGSTEWVEQHMEMLTSGGAVYINTDDSGRGFLGLGGSPTVQKMFNEVAENILDPETHVNLLERDRMRMMVAGDKAAGTEPELPMHPLGSGSDFAPFLQHIGIAAMDLGFYGENYGGYYHSLYDTYDHYMRFGDPGFYYGMALAKTVGHTILRFADADVLPYNFNDFAHDVDGYVASLKSEMAGMRQKASYRDKLISLNAYEIAANPSKKYVPPSYEKPVPYLNFAPLKNALGKFNKSASDYDKVMSQQLSQGLHLNPVVLDSLNKELIKASRALTYPQGLPGTPWYKQEIYATGPTTGYSVKTLPAIRIAIEEHKWEVASKQIKVVAGVLNHFSEVVEHAATMLKNNSI